MLRLVGMYAVVPRYQVGAIAKPFLKPGNLEKTHNE